MNQCQRKMIIDWMRKIHQLEYAHCYQSVWYSKLDTYLGLSAFALTTIVAFVYRFPDINSELVQNYNLGFLKKEYSVPFLSLLAALATGFLAFLKASEKASLHQKIGMSYEMLRHEIEIFLTSATTSEVAEVEIKRIEKAWNDLNTAYLSNKNFKKGKETIKMLNKYPEPLSFLPDQK